MFRGKWFEIVGVILTLVMLRISWGEDIPVNGKVLGADGKPIAGAQVYACRVDNVGTPYQVVGRVQSGERGDFELSPPLFGEEYLLDYITFLAYKPGFAWGMSLSSRRQECPIVLLLLAPGSVAGRVLDLDGRPIRGAKVRPEVRLQHGYCYFQAGPAEGPPFPEATTDEAGAFRLDNLPVGAECTLSVEAVGYASQRYGPQHYYGKDAFEVPKQGIEIRLGPESAVKGTLRWATTGKPVPGIPIFAAPLPYGSSRRGVTDANGAFLIRGLRAGEYRLLSPSRWRMRELGGVLVASDPIKIGTGQVVEGISLQLTEGVIVEGRVLHAESRRPIPHAGVHLQRGQMEGPIHPKDFSVTDSNGVFRLRTRLGKRRIVVNHAWHKTVEKDFNIAEQPVARVGEILLPPTPKFFVKVTDEAGNPVSRAHVVGFAVCDDRGFAELPVSKGSCNCTVLSADGRLGAFFWAPGKAEDVLQVVLRPCGVITGLVNRPDGRPVPNAAVSATLIVKQDVGGYSTGGCRSARTDIAGKYVISGLIPVIPNHEYGLRVSPTDFARFDQIFGWNKKTYKVNPGEVIQAEPITLFVGDETLSGRVTNSNGIPVSDAELYLYTTVFRPEKPGERWQAMTGQDGRFKFVDILREPMDLRVSRPNCGAFSCYPKPDEFGDVKVVLP